MGQANSYSWEKLELLGGPARDKDVVGVLQTCDQLACILGVVVLQYSKSVEILEKGVRDKSPESSGRDTIGVAEHDKSCHKP